MEGKVFVMTWDDYRGKPGVFETFERALHHASKKGVTDFKEINPGVWRSGTWWIDECSVIPDFEANSFKPSKEGE